MEVLNSPHFCAKNVAEEVLALYLAIAVKVIFGFSKFLHEKVNIHKNYPFVYAKMVVWVVKSTAVCLLDLLEPSANLK